MNAAELSIQLDENVDRVRRSLQDLETRAIEYAKAERAYRLAKATAYLSTTGTVAEREARAEPAINEIRYSRDLAEGLRLSGLEAVRSNRGVLSAIQSLAGLYRAEAEFDRTGSDWGKSA